MVFYIVETMGVKTKVFYTLKFVDKMLFSPNGKDLGYAMIVNT